jgi:hypothetical protein
MTIHSRSTRCLATAAVATLPALFAFGCGGDDDTVTPPPATTSVTSVSVNPTSVVGGTASQGSVNVSPTSSSAVNVALSSSNAAATVPGSVTVNGGASNASFTVNTTAVAASTAVTITATLNGTQTTTLTVTPPNVPTARFVVRSLSDSKRKLNTDPAPVTILPAGTLDACPLVTNAQGNASFDCVFDGGTSTPTTIQKYIWAYFVGPRQRGPDPNDPRTTSTLPTLKPDESSCNFFGGLQSTSSGALQFISMRVDLQVQDATGLSAVVSSQNIRIFPAGQCGYGF